MAVNYMRRSQVQVRQSRVLYFTPTLYEKTCRFLLVILSAKFAVYVRTMILSLRYLGTCKKNVLWEKQA